MSDQETPQPAKLIDSLHAMGASTLELLRSRVELIAIEWQEEQERGKEILVLTAIGGLLLALSSLLLTFLIVVCFWDTYRLQAIVGVTALYFGGGVWSLLQVKKKLRDRPAPFAASLQEFANDVQLLQRHRADASTPDSSPNVQSPTASGSGVVR